MNPHNVVKLLSEFFPPSAATEASEREQELADEIRRMLIRAEEQPEDSTDLDFVIFGHEEEDSSDDESVEDLDDTGEEEVTKKPPIDYSWDELREIADLSHRQKFSVIQHRYRKLHHRMQLKRIVDYVEHAGNHPHKSAQLIKQRVVERFADWKARRIVVHDRDLRTEALKAAKEINIPFSASHAWIAALKRENGIVSRKIEAYVTEKSHKEASDIKAEADAFVQSLRSGQLMNRLPSAVYNTDQSGLQLEMIGGRTLEWRGEKHVFGRVQRVAPTTHSFTIQPCLRLDGRLQFPMCVCFYEPGGAPKKFLSELAITGSWIYAVSTNSGKMTSELMNDWFTDVFQPISAPDSLLIVDSWGGFKQMMQENAGKAEFAVIPKGGTKYVQPVDVFFARQYKEFIRRVSDLIRLREIDYTLSTRLNLAKLLALTHSQFCAPIFEDFIRYSWFKSGYLDDHPPPFRTPPQFCLSDFDAAVKCGRADCDELCIIRCAYCKNFFCHKHCLVELHKCINMYDEWVPTDIDTLYGGHYISEGKLEWRRIDSSTIADEDADSPKDDSHPLSKLKPKSVPRQSKESKGKLLKKKPVMQVHSKPMKRKNEEGCSKLMPKEASKKLEDDKSVVEIWSNGVKKANEARETGNGSTEKKPALIKKIKEKGGTRPKLKSTPKSKSKPVRSFRFSDRAAPPSMKPGRFFEPPSTQRPACTEGGESSKGREPAPPREPAKPVQPREPLAPREPSTPREQREPVKAQQPRASVEPIKPIAPRSPQDPKDPKDPREPRKPQDPKDPKEPANPKEPRKPAEPKAHIDPK